MSILQGLQVVEISGNGAAGWATKHFADWGARVTILEPAEHAPLRSDPIKLASPPRSLFPSAC